MSISRNRPWGIARRFRPLWRRVCARLSRLPADSRGAISLVAVFAVMLLTMLLGMVMNVGRQADGKMRMQNAADAVAYSGGVALTRGMNTLAYTNHLLCEVFAMTAIMREGRDANASARIPEIVAAWKREAPEFASAPMDKFRVLASAIPPKVDAEQQMVDAYAAWIAALSDATLPIFEMILAEELIPKYQRAVAAIFPEIAQMAAIEIAARNGRPDHGRGPMIGVLWRTDVVPVGLDETYQPTLPVVDPQMAPDPDYRTLARRQRNNWAMTYLNTWNGINMAGFDRVATLTQFGQLWRSFTCGQLRKLLDEEYPETNLVYQIHREARSPYFQDRFMFVGVVYWRKLPDMMPGVFRAPLASDAVTYAQVRMFVPAPKLQWQHESQGGGGNPGISLGGVPGHSAMLVPDEPADPTANPGGPGRWVVRYEPVPTHWDLLNQHWTCQLVPAVGPNLSMILGTSPPIAEFGAANLRLPNTAALDDRMITNISPH